MILYLDTSALVKKYIAEPGSDAVARAIKSADVIGSAVITRVEISAAINKAVRIRILSSENASTVLKNFRKNWIDVFATEITKPVITRAETFAWEHKLRGYDAVHLAAASIWHDDLSQPVTFATFDLNLWNAAAAIGLTPFPDNLPELIMQWRS